jgi:hypothetical protein
LTLKREIQGMFSWNCMAAVVVSKPVISGMVTRKLAIAASSATQRTTPAWSSRPSASNSAPATIGSQMATLNRPMLFFSCSDQRPTRPAR